MVPDVDIDNLAAQMLPSAQRKPYWIIFVRSLTSPVKRLAGLLRYYMGGSTDTGYWSNIITYSKGDLVRSIDGVFESLTDGNIGHDLTDSAYWIKVLSSFIGANERVKYNGRKLTFEWALNRYFNTTFRQPDDPVTPTPSDIYILNIAPSYASFVSYLTLRPEDTSYLTPTQYYSFDTLILTTASSYEFSINIPLAVFNSLGANNPIRESIVRQFADRYAATGTYYQVITY